MSFKSVLKTIEEDALKGVAIFAKVEGYEPLANILIGSISPKAANVATAVEQKTDVTFTDLKNITQQIQLAFTAQNPPLSNDQKLAAEAAIAGQLLQAFGHITDKNVGDSAEVSAGVSDLMKAVVRIQSALKAN